MTPERKISRRGFLIGAGATAFLAACDAGSIIQTGQDRKEDKEDGPRMGDIIIGNNEAQLLRNDMRYFVRDLALYLRLSGTKGKVFQPSESEARAIFSKYPPGQINNNFRVDIEQGDIKRLSPDGGRKLIYAQGFLSADSRPNAQIIPRTDAFIRFRKRLKSEGWDPDPNDPSLRDILHLDSYIFSYQEDELKTFGIGDTLRDPVINKDYALKFVKKRSEQNPFDQYDGIAHSLGGIFILAMAMEHPDLFNNLIFINSPIMGLDLNILQKIGVGILKELIASYGLDSTKVIDYLSKLWDVNYHAKLKKFFTDFTKRGGKVLIVATEGDVFVTRESTGIDMLKNIDGVEILIVKAGNVNPFSSIDVFNAHGLGLGDEKVLDSGYKMVGKNLSTS